MYMPRHGLAKQVLLVFRTVVHLLQHEAKIADLRSNEDQNGQCLVCARQFVVAGEPMQ